MSPLVRQSKVGNAAERYVRLAVRGLVPMFNAEEQLFCYKLRKTEHGLVQEGLSQRYTMMTLMGLHRLQQAGEESPVPTAPIFERLLADLDWVDNIGDLGVLLWMCGVTCPERYADVNRRLELKTALDRYPDAKTGYTMQLAWFLTGLSYWAQTVPERRGRLEDIACRTYSMLKRNLGKGGYFGHLHTGSSLSGFVRGRIGSFADQVYPIYAFNQFSKAFGNKEAQKLALECGFRICQAQGPLGQWWWHYDGVRGEVFEGYPVFSVHQHAMGPMTLFALGEATGHDFTSRIYKGLEWVNLRNELGVEMDDEGRNIIWRCIYRAQSPVLTYLRAGLLDQSKAVRANRSDLKILFECRPYELGWLLYAFANRL